MRGSPARRGPLRSRVWAGPGAARTRTFAGASWQACFSICSRLMPLGSGSVAIVSSMPAAATIPAMSIARFRPSVKARKSGNRNAPANAPSLPAPADMPWPAVLTSVGKISAG
jgi:hypothetical protein